MATKETVKSFEEIRGDSDTVIMEPVQVPEFESLWVTRYGRDPIWGIEESVQKPMAQRLAPVLRGQAKIEDILVEQEPVETLPAKYDSLRAMIDADKDPQGYREKMAASLLLSERLGVQPSTAFRDWDYLTEQLYHAPMKPAQFLQNYRKRMGIEFPKPEFKPNIVTPDVERIRQQTEQATPYYEPIIPGIADRAGEDPNRRMSAAPLRETGKPWIPNPNLVPPPQPETGGPEYKNMLDEFYRAFQSNDASLFASAVKFVGIHPVSEWLAPEWSRSVRDYADQVRAVANSPEFAPTGGGGISGFISRAVAGTLPFTMATTGAYLTGGASAAFSVATVGEGVPSYEYALEKTHDEGTALINGIVVGTINGAIEKLQVSEILGTMNATRLYSVSRRAQVKALNKISDQGKSLTRQYIETAVSNGIQESLQETVTLGGEYWVSDVDVLDALERVAASGVGGAVGGVFLGAAGGMTQYAAAKALGQTDQQAEQSAQVVRDVAQQTGAAVVRPGRAELKQGLTQSAAISDEQAEFAMKILDAAAAAQDQSTDEYIQTHIAGVEQAEDHADRVERIKVQGFSDTEAETIASTMEELEREAVATPSIEAKPTQQKRPQAAESDSLTEGPGSPTLPSSSAIGNRTPQAAEPSTRKEAAIQLQQNRLSKAREFQENYQEIENDEGAARTAYKGWKNAVTEYLQGVADELGIKVDIEDAATGSRYVRFHGEFSGEDFEREFRLSNHPSKNAGWPLNIEGTGKEDWEKVLPMYEKYLRDDVAILQHQQKGAEDALQVQAQGAEKVTKPPMELYQEDEGQLFDDQQQSKPLRKPRKTITAEVERYLGSVLKSDPAAMSYEQILSHLQDLRALARVFPNREKQIRSAMKQAESFKPQKREIAKEISSTQKDIITHDIYQQTLDDLLAQLEDITPGAVEPTFKGEVENFLEGKPYLKGQIIIGSTGTLSTWDKQLQQWAERTGKTDPANINTWLDLVDLKMRLQQGRSVNPEALARAVQTQEPNIVWLADKLKMLKSGKSLKEIRAAEKKQFGEAKPKPKTAEKTDDDFSDFLDFEAKPRRKAATRFLEDGRAVIKAFQGADISSVVHELAHIFRRGVRGEDLKALEKWAGVVDGNWTRQAEEKFARGFEKYLYEGRAPSSTMQRVFDAFRKWLLDIYRSIEKSAINIQITDDVRRVFDRILTLERSEIHPGEMSFVDFNKKLSQEMASPNSVWITRYGIDLEQSPFLEWKRMKELHKQTQQDIVDHENQQAEAVTITAEQSAEIALIESEEPAEPFILDAKKLIISDLLDKASKDGLNKVRAKKALREAYAAGETAGTKEAQAKGKEKLVEKLAEAKEYFRQVTMEVKARKAIRETILKLGRRISKSVPAQVAIEYKEMIAAIQDGFDPAFRSKKTIGNRQRLRDIAHRNPGMVPPDTLKRFGKKSIGEFYFDELEAMADLVDSLKRQGKEKYAAWREKWDQDRQTEIDAIKATLEDYEPGEAKPASPSMEKRPGYLVRAVKGLRAASLRPSVLADLIDGGKALYNGMAFRLIRTLSNEARNAEIAGLERRQAAFDAFMKSKGLSIHDLQKTIRLGNKDFTVDDAVGIYTRRLNSKSKLAMINGNGITEEQLAQAVYYCEITNPRLADLSKFILDEYDANYLSLDDAYVKDTGLAGNPRRMVKENNYTSIIRLEVYDQRSGDFKNQSEGEVLAEQNQLLRGIGRYYTEKGMTRARKNIPAEFQSRILLGLVEGWMRDVSRQEHYKSHVELQKIYHKVFWNREIADLIQHRLGNEYQTELKALLNRTIDPDSIRKYDWGSVFFRSTKKNTGIAFLALNFMSILKAPVSVITYSPFCGGPARLVGSALKFAAHPVGMWNSVRDKAPQVKRANIDQLLDDLRRDLSYVRAGRLGGLAKARDRTQAAFMSLYSLIDGISRTIGWDATYQYHLSMDESEDQARAAADEATLRTQGASAARDLPGLYAKNEALTAFLTFTNELNQAWNLMTYDTPRHWVNKQYVRAAMTLFGVLLSESIIWAITYRRLPEDKKDIASMVANTLADPIPLVGSVLGSRELYPIAGSAKTALTSVGKAIVEGDFDKINMKAILETAALLYGIPYIGPKRIYQAVSEGEPLYLVGGPKRKKAM